MQIKDDWDELDIIAKAQLKPHDYDFFLDYKADLKEDGRDWSYARMTLTGYLWDMSDLYLQTELA